MNATPKARPNAKSSLRLSAISLLLVGSVVIIHAFAVLTPSASAQEPPTVEEIQANHLADISQKLDEQIQQNHNLWLSIALLAAIIIGDIIYRHFFRRNIHE